MPKIAIITRTKNRPLFLERAIRSVENQSFKDYVHVIFNDGGDKEPVDKLLSVYSNKKRIVVHTKSSVGITKALNQAIRSVDSTYITILDDDDTWSQDRLKKTVEYLENNEAEAVAVKMDVVLEEVKDGKVHKIEQYLHAESGEGEISLYKQCKRNYLSNGVITYSRKLYDKLGGYDEGLETAEDWDFGIRLLLETDVPLLKTDKALSFYHQRPSQKGDAGNAVYKQEEAINKLRNNYLRRDLRKGQVGIGYIMSALEHDISLIVRLESHINRTATTQSNRILENLQREMAEVVRQNTINVHQNRIDKVLIRKFHRLLNKR